MEVASSLSMPVAPVSVSVLVEPSASVMTAFVTLLFIVIQPVSEVGSVLLEEVRFTPFKIKCVVPVTVSSA